MSASDRLKWSTSSGDRTDPGQGPLFTHSLRRAGMPSHRDRVLDRLRRHPESRQHLLSARPMPSRQHGGTSTADHGQRCLSVRHRLGTGHSCRHPSQKQRRGDPPKIRRLRHCGSPLSLFSHACPDQPCPAEPCRAPPALPRHALPNHATPNRALPALPSPAKPRRAIPRLASLTLIAHRSSCSGRALCCRAWGV